MMYNTAERNMEATGLRSYMLRVYNYMTAGLAVTGVTAYVVANTPFLLNMFYSVSEQGNFELTVLGWIVILSPLAFVFALSYGVERMRTSTVQFLFWLFAGIFGLSLSYVFLTYTGLSIARVFFITAATFAGLSLYGYTTNKDLSGFGTFLLMGLTGVIIASVVNLFIASTALHFIISIIGVIVFAGLTAYDTQRIKEMYNDFDNSEVVGKKAIMGALSLYLDFVNLFMLMLTFFGDRK